MGKALVIRIFYLVVSVFSVAMVYLAIEEPYYSELLNGGEVSANMQMNAVTDYEMNATTISARYEADTWNRYPEFDELVKFRAEIFKGNKKHNVSSNKAFYNGGRIILQGDVHYANNENLTFVSEEVVYSTATKVATTQKPFMMTQNEDKVVGKALVYDFELKKAYIKKAFAMIEQNKKDRTKK